MFVFPSGQIHTELATNEIMDHSSYGCSISFPDAWLLSTPPSWSGSTDFSGNTALVSKPVSRVKVLLTSKANRGSKGEDE